jgi:hypothetical protein
LGDHLDVDGLVLGEHLEVDGLILGEHLDVDGLVLGEHLDVDGFVLIVDFIFSLCFLSSSTFFMKLTTGASMSENNSRAAAV